MAKKGDMFVQAASINISISSLFSDSEPFSERYRAEDKIGWIIHRVEYAPGNGDSILPILDSDDDCIRFGISALKTQPSTGFKISDYGVIDYHAVRRCDLAAPAADVVNFERWPITTDFSTLPGGGYLVHPVNLFCWGHVEDTLGDACVLYCRILYTTIDPLPKDMYDELWQAIYVRQQ